MGNVMTTTALGYFWKYMPNIVYWHHLYKLFIQLFNYHKNVYI